MNHLYACMIAREFPLQSLLRFQQELRNTPIAVLGGEAPNEQVCSISDAARAMGVMPGMTRVETNIFPAVTALSRSAAQEKGARTALLECAGSFSPRVEDQSSDSCFLCVADITGTETLFGPPSRLAETMRKQAADLRINTSIAISSNFHASISLALGCFTLQKNGICVVPPGMEPSALAPLPLSVLPISLEQAETFSLWGLRTLGELANIEDKELVTRLGQAGKTLHLLAGGKAPHLFRALEPGLHLEERIELDPPVDLLESLLFVAGVLLDQLIVRVQSRVLALASITLELGLDNGTVHTRTVRPALPTNDRQLWLKLSHLDLQAHPPAAGIRSLVLQGQPGATSKVQLGLFSPQTPEPMRLEVTLARIRSIVGDDCVGMARLNDSHRPDAFRMEAFHVATGESKTPAAGATALQRMAVRQLRPAETVKVILHNQQPHSFTFREKRYQVERAYGPWSSSGDWWKPTLWSIEQWDIVASGQDTWLCCCLTHDRTQKRWQIEALYD